MKNGLSAVKLALLAFLVIGMLDTISCSQSTPSAPAATATPTVASEVGRYQVIVTTEGERGSVLFLVDTKEGSTWIYRPPQGPLFNGFWSDIPRVTNPAETWQQAFQQMMTRPAAAAPAAGTAAAPAAAPTAAPTH
jgi:hypothetical protein